MRTKFYGCIAVALLVFIYLSIWLYVQLGELVSWLRE